MAEKASFLLVFLLSVVFSVGGILLGIVLPGRSADAGRGGALGTAVALGFLFITRDYGGKLYYAISDEIPALKKLFDKWKREKYKELPPATTPLLDAVRLQHRVDTLAASIALNGRSHFREAQFMGAATAIGTVAWGFGDWIAQAMLNLKLVIAFQSWMLQRLCEIGFHF